MATPADATHTLLVYRSGDRADSALRALCERTRDAALRTQVTVVVLVRQEDPRSGCCDTRAVLWNEVCRDLAKEELSKASRVVGDEPNVDLTVLVAPDRGVIEAIEHEARARDVDEIVLADRRRSGLGALEIRRLRRRSAVPVHT